MSEAIEGSTITNGVGSDGIWSDVALTTVCVMEANVVSYVKDPIAIVGVNCAIVDGCARVSKGEGDALKAVADIGVSGGTHVRCTYSILIESGAGANSGNSHVCDGDTISDVSGRSIANNSSVMGVAIVKG